LLHKIRICHKCIIKQSYPKSIREQKGNALRKLNEIDLDLDLAGTEGLDANYISRARTQYLYAQHQAMVTQTQFADAKGAALLTLIGLIAFRGPQFEMGAHATPLVAIYYIAIALSILFAFAAVFPRYPGKSVRSAMAQCDRWSWPALSDDSLSPDEFSRFMQTSEVSQLVHSVSLSNSHIASILFKKFRMLRMAFFFALIVLALLGVQLAGFFEAVQA